MTTGFTQRFRGKIGVRWGGIWQDGVQSAGILLNAGVPTNGTSGTYAGLAPPAALLLDTTNAVVYCNTNTLASPTWTSQGLNAGAGSFTTLIAATSFELGTGTKTAAATAGAATLNKPAGVITSEALTTAAGATYVLTLTDSSIAAADQVFASVALGSATTGMPAVTTVAPAAGSVVITIQNIHASAALNGTIKVAFFVAKN